MKEMESKFKTEDINRVAEREITGHMHDLLNGHIQCECQRKDKVQTVEQVEA